MPLLLSTLFKCSFWLWVGRKYNILYSFCSKVWTKILSSRPLIVMQIQYHNIYSIHLFWTLWSFFSFQTKMLVRHSFWAGDTWLDQMDIGLIELSCVILNRHLEQLKIKPNENKVWEGLKGHCCWELPNLGTKTMTGFTLKGLHVYSPKKRDINW